MMLASYGVSLIIKRYDDEEDDDICEDDNVLTVVANISRIKQIFPLKKNKPITTLSMITQEERRVTHT